MIDSMTASDTKNDLSALFQLTSGAEKVQQQLLQQLASAGDAGLDVLMEFLLQRRSEPPTWVEGKAYQVLYKADSAKAREFLQTHFPVGVVPLNSERSIDYSSLQQLLSHQDFQAADRLTLQKLCELAGSAAMQRKWLYFTEVENFPKLDLQTINTLWLVHSEGKFGFSVQREIWLGSPSWEKFWPKIGWKTGNSWTRYPDGFTWNLTAPKGHLPLSNQLRGVRVIA
ncbi:MAG: GUN4 N-terminal ARM-like repeat domain-containing protein, partial [Chroococcidiopsidaceae cyanobacterium CP_BM_ER_R8_30]|nr:GUN4 N-terminal ARM-like repeat domain-containing protein [Chroococcidiopsidaceae cyanobacterium CP_BM_ER_R8_30]